MAYHIFIGDGSSTNNFLLDLYLGSAATIDMYWESIGRKLGLRIISALTERADSEVGLVLRGAELVEFRNEMNLFESYWIKESSNDVLPREFLTNIREIIVQTENAIDQGLTVMVG